MRQLLMLGFYCEVYRREPRCRVYVNDMLLDEFNIPHSPYKHIDETLKDILDPMPDEDSIISKSCTPFLKYIEFDDQNFREVDIRIEIQNNDNNYTNGFMTKYTRVKLSCIFLASKKMLNRIDELKNNWKFSRKNYQVRNKKDLGVFYQGKRGWILENLAKTMTMNFANLSKIPPDLLKISYWIGSSGFFHLTPTKRFGFWVSNENIQKGYYKLGWINSVEQIYNKYKQYENQRSSNT